MFTQASITHHNLAQCRAEMWKKSLKSGLLFLLGKLVTDLIYERKKGVKTHLKERIEIFLRLSIHDNGVRHEMKCLQGTLRRTNVRESSL